MVALAPDSDPAREELTVMGATLTQSSAILKHVPVRELREWEFGFYSCTCS